MPGGAGASADEARRYERTRGAMRVLLPDGAAGVADPILELLKKYKSIAVVGLSSNPMRPSYGVTEYMQSAGYRIIPVNPNEEEVAAVVESAIRAGAKVVWMQLGVENEAASERARAAGLTVVEDSCILIEHRKRLRQLNS